MRACFESVLTAGVLPSLDVIRRRDRRYYDPLGLPLRSAPFRTRLIRHALSRRGRRRRISRVPHFSLNACCAPYPGEIHRALRCMLGGHGLRREMTGSALPLFLCRGCRLHLMLRPAFLLHPRGLSLWTLLTPCFDGTCRRGPATRLSGDYLAGTCTRWRSAARRRARSPLPASLHVFVTTHHRRQPITSRPRSRRSRRRRRR